MSMSQFDELQAPAEDRVSRCSSMVISCGKEVPACKVITLDPALTRAYVIDRMMRTELMQLAVPSIGPQQEPAGSC